MTHIRQSRGAVLFRRFAATRPGQVFTTFFRGIGADDLFGMAAEMAYRFLFAIFPLLLLLVSSLGFVGDALGFDDLFARVLAQVQPLLPADIYALLEQFVTGLLETRSTTVLTISLLGTIWGAAGGVGTLIKGLDRAYDVEQRRPFWRQQLVALAVTAIIPPAGLALVIVAVLGNTIAAWLGTGLGMEGMAGTMTALARWPVLAAVMMVSLSLLYFLLPSERHGYLWSLPGAALATAGWLLITQFFSLYVANFGNYNATYGSFGAIIIFLLWLYLVGAVVLLGAEFNQAVELTFGSRAAAEVEDTPTAQRRDEPTSAA